MNKLLTAIIIAFVSHGYLYSQCTPDVVTTTDYCPDQNAAWSIANPNPSTTSYRWYRQNPDLTFTGYPYADVFETPEVFPNGHGTVSNYYYEKEIKYSGGPANPTTFTDVTPNSTNLSLQYSSSNAFVLNYVTVAITSYFDDPNKTLRLKVGANGAFSEWFTFRLNDPTVVVGSFGNTRLIRVPVFGSPNNLGLNVPAGTSQITVFTSDATTPPTGSQPVDALTWIGASNFSPTYTIAPGFTTNYSGTAPNSIQNISGNPRIPGILGMDIVIKCGLTNVTAVQETNAANCCTPVSNSSTVTSSTGSNIFITPFPSGVVLTANGNSSSLYYRWYKDGVPLGASFEGVGLTSIPISSVGNYSVRVVQDATFINRSACFKQTPFDAQNRILFAKASDTDIFLGETVNLIAEGESGPTTWTSLNGPVLQNSNQVVANATPLTVGKYTYRVEAEVPVGNLVVNGGFENGNVGFSNSGYVYSNPASAVNLTSGEAWAEGYPDRKKLNFGNGGYTINDYVFWPGYNAWKPCRSRTGTGNFLYTDGATGAGYVWEQTVNVVAGRTYEFGAWIANINVDSDPAISSNPAGNPLPKINIYINGSPLFVTPINLTGAVCEWEKVSQTWTAPISGTVTIRVDEISKNNYGNDFAIDDIFFGSPGFQTDTVSVHVTDCNFINLSQSTCVGDSIQLSAVTNGAFITWFNQTQNNISTIGKPTNSVTNVASGGGDTYRATAKFNFGNLLTNGDFESGNVGFTRTFDFLGSCCSNPGTYTIGNNPSSLNGSFTNPVGTGGSGRYYIGDARFDASRRIAWRQTVNIPVTGEYLFTLDLANVATQIGTVNAQTTRLEIRIGTSVYTLTAPPDLQWRKYGFVYDATSTGNVEISITSLITSTNPTNGFVMDNLAFSPSITKTAEITPSICLPVNFININAKYSNGLLTVDWVVANEINVSHYIVEASKDGNHFDIVSKTMATASNLDIKHYLSKSESNQYSYIRVKQYDLDGKSSISPTLYVFSDSQKPTLFPNPFTQSITIKLDDEDSIAYIEVKNTLGEVVDKSIVHGGETYLGDNWASGVYFITLHYTDKIEIKKIIKH